MSSNRIFFIVFLLTAAAATVYLINTINSSIQQSSRIEEAEKKIISQLKLIRQAESAFVSVNGRYTSNWDSLVNFVKNDVFYVTEKTETIYEIPYRPDSIVVNIDTLGTVPVYDSLFAKVPNFDVNRLPYVPGYENVKFKAYANKIDKSGLMVAVIEVWNPKPVSPERDEDSEYTTRKPLRFGSQFSVTTAGNWE